MSRYQLQIKEPCHEDWSKMLSQEQGRFCESCSKTVVDFTSASNTQVLDFFKNKNENTCGRFSQKQIDQIFVPHQKHSLIGPLAGSLSLLSMVVSPHPVHSQKWGLTKVELQKGQKNEGEIVPLEKQLSAIDSVRVVTDTLRIHGMLTENHNEVLPFGNISVYKDSTQVYGTTSDFDGNFILEIPKEWLKDTLLLKASFLGYAPVEHVFVPNKLNSSIHIQMTSENVVLGDVVMVKDTPWRRFKRWWSK